MVGILEAMGNSEAMKASRMLFDEYLGDQEEGFSFEVISKLEQHWRKCFKAKGDYTEK